MRSMKNLVFGGLGGLLLALGTLAASVGAFVALTGGYVPKAEAAIVCILPPQKCRQRVPTK